MRLVLLGLFVAACRTSAPDAFRVPEDQFRAHTRTILLVPFEDSRVEAIAAAQVALEGALETGLTSAGFRVIPASAFRARWEHALEASGGIFDPRTGREDREKAQRLRTQCLGELHRAQPFDALCHVSLERRAAEFFGDHARWDGFSEPLRGLELKDSFVDSVHGRVGALSLVVRIVRAGGGLEYEHAAGLQLLCKVQNAQLVALTEGELLADPARNAAAAEQVLAPLARR